jgi:heat shock protein HslJ
MLRIRRATGRALLGLGAIIAVVLSACGDDSNDSATTAVAGAGAASLNGTSWVLSSYVDAAATVTAVAVAALDFGSDGSTLSGSTGCNSFGGKFVQDGTKLTITLGPATLKACTDDAANKQEQAILEQLPLVASFTGGQQLTLQDKSGSTLLVYTPGTAGLEGTSWTGTGVNTGSAVESNALTETITATFGPSGALSGFAGCNDYTATYKTSGSDGLTITEVATTRKACDESKSALEAQYTAALEKVASYSISGTTLTLRDSSGAIQASYALVP